MKLSFLLHLAPSLCAFSMSARLEPVNHLSKRDAVNITRQNQGAWLTEFQFGSEKQDVTVTFDFGASWGQLISTLDGCNMNITEADQYSNSSSTTDTCVFTAPYNVRDLKNFTLVPSNISDVYLDMLTVGDLELLDFEFTMYPDTFDVNTIGFGLNNSGRSFGVDDYDNSTHNNFVQQLHQQGAIDLSVLSMWFSQTNGSVEGQFLVGGIDELKYDGTLYKYPMLNSFEMLYEVDPVIEVKMSYVASDKFNITMPVAMGIYPDRMFSSFPDGFLDVIAKAYGAKYSDAWSTVYFKDSSKWRNLDDNFVFGLGDLNLTVPLKDLLETHDTPLSDGRLYLTMNNGSTEAWLGMDVLRFAYIAVDYDSREVAIAQAANTTESDEKLLTNGFSDLPLAYAANDTSVALQYFISTSTEVGLTTKFEAVTTNWSSSLNGGSSGSSFSALFFVFACFLLGL